MLERYGYTVLPAPGAQHAETLAREHNRDIALLITDVVMPEMDGSTLAKLLQAAHPG